MKQSKHLEWCFGFSERRISTVLLVLSDHKVQWMGDGLHHGVNYSVMVEQLGYSVMLDGIGLVYVCI